MLDNGRLASRAYGCKEWKHDEVKEFQGLTVSFQVQTESLECPRRVLTKVEVTSRTYGLKRVDTMLRKWDVKTIKG